MHFITLRNGSPHTPAPHIARIAAVGLALCAFAIAPGSAQAAQTKAKVPTFPVPASARPQPNNPGNAGSSIGSAVTTGSTATAPAASPGVGNHATPGTKPAKHANSTKLSTPALALAILAALLALACLAWGVARLTAYEPRWVLSMRHSLAEGGFRASATWAEFTDWARLGK